MHNTGQMQSLYAGPAKSWMRFMRHVLNTFGYHLVVVQADLVGYLIVGFGYYLVSCTLSETQSCISKQDWDPAYDTCPHGIAGST